MSAAANVPPFLLASLSAQLGEAGPTSAAARVPERPLSSPAGITSAVPIVGAATPLITPPRVASPAAPAASAASGSKLQVPRSDATPTQTGALAKPVPTQPLPAPAGLDILAAQALVVPPLNFDMVAAGVYRSGHPNERNFEFMRRLGLRSIMYLSAEDYRPHVVQWAESQGVQILHHRLNVNKEPFGEMDEDVVAAALADILDRRNLPVLIHCNKGKYRVGVLAALVRRLQGWSLTSVYSEYERFAGSKIADEEFIELFPLSRLRADAAHRPVWLTRT